jgi:uncharacterized protein YyaL (SSP411 family)
VLDDYAFLAAGLVDLFEATQDARWLREAIALEDVLASEFADDAGGGFFLTAADGEAPLARLKLAHDGAVPSGNAVAAETLLRLAELTGDDARRAAADRVLQALGGGLARDPMGSAALAAALDFRLDRPKEIVIVRPAADGGGGAALLAAVHAAYTPNRVLVDTVEGEALARLAPLVPLVDGKQALGGAATAYVCEARVCARPATAPGALAAELARVHPLPQREK